MPFFYSYGGSSFKSQTELQYALQKAYDEVRAVESRARRSTVLRLAAAVVSMSMIAFVMLFLSGFPSQLLEQHTYPVNLSTAVTLVSTLALAAVVVGVVLTFPWLLRRASEVADRQAREQARVMFDPKLGAVMVTDGGSTLTVMPPPTFYPSGQSQPK